MSNLSNNGNSYEDLCQLYDPKKYFKETKITINYMKKIGGVERKYKITKIFIDEDSANNFIDEDLKNSINELNDNIINIGYPTGWQIFYLYKEIFQILNEVVKGNLYFRGQSHSYDMRPGVMREGYRQYRQDFEKIYSKISREFPDQVKYYSLDSLNEREEQLSMLQHYGLKTSLLDITKNPYIAMLFMLPNAGDFSKYSSDYKEPTFFIYVIKDNQNTLFSEVRRNSLNERIIAQNGAFLNFDKILSSDVENISHISMVTIVLKFDDEGYRKYLNSEKNNIVNVGQEDDSATTPDNVEVNREKIDYEKSIEKELSDSGIENAKKDCLSQIFSEIRNKLKEYYYFTEDLFPDFEKKIQYYSNKYEARNSRKLDIPIKRPDEEIAP